MTTMKLGRRHFTAGAVAGAASFGLPALAQGEPIKVGVIVPLSGPAGPNGQGVAHARFGEGVVTGIEGSGDDARVQVKFAQHGSKWLALAIAKLEPV